MKYSYPPLYLLFLLVFSFAGCATSEPPAQKVLSSQLAPTAAAPAPAYVIRQGESLDIKFFYNPSLNEHVIVRPDGMISLQLVGEVKAAGLTPAELKAELTERYESYLQVPEVAVIVKEVTGQKVFVGGEVQTPGIVSLAGNMTSLRAIMQAGGFKNTARPETVIIIRDRGTESPLFTTINLMEDLTNIAHNDLPLQPYDIVYVPKSTIAMLDQFMEQYFDKLIPITKTFGFSYFYNLSPQYR